MRARIDAGGGQTTDTQGAGPLLKTQIRENLALILENGKALLAAQSADLSWTAR